MSIEIEKDILKIEEMRGRIESQILVDAEVYLNSSRTEIEKILWVDGLVDILNTKIVGKSILVSGLVRFKIIYQSSEGDEGIYSLDSNVDFREEIDLSNISEEMEVSAKAYVEHIEEEIVDKNKVMIKALIGIEGKVYHVNHIEVISDIEEKAEVQTLREKIKYKEIQDKAVSYTTIEDTLSLGEEDPPIEDILKISIDAYKSEITAAEGRLILSGLIRPKIIYYGGEQIRTMAQDIQFNHFLDMAQVNSESICHIEIEVMEGSWEVLEDEMGKMKELDLEVKLKISGKSYYENEKELIVDMYSTKERIQIETENVNLIESIGELIHREDVYKDLQDYNIKEIYDLSGYGSIIDSRFGEDGLVIEGLLTLQGIYLEDGGQIKTLREEVPYKCYLPSREDAIGCDLDISLIVEDVDIRDVNKVHAIIKHKINMSRNRILSLIKTIEETEEIIEKKDRPSIIIYLVQNHDTLWDIAKRYNTSMDEIVAANENINPNNILPGEKIIIEKKIDVSF